MHCHQCGRQIDESLPFCTYCGAKQFPDTGHRTESFDDGMKKEWYKGDTFFPVGGGGSSDFDYDDYDQDSLVFDSYDDGKQPIRWFPIAIAIGSVLLLAGIVIVIWMQFFSKNSDDVQFTDPTRVTFNPRLMTWETELETTTTRSTVSVPTFRDVTSKPTTMTTRSTADEMTSPPTTTAPSDVRVVVVTDPAKPSSSRTPRTKPKTTSVKKTKPLQPILQPILPPQATSPPVTTPKATPPPVTTPKATPPPVTTPKATPPPVTTPEEATPPPVTTPEATLPPETTTEVTLPPPTTTPPAEEEPVTTVSQPIAALSIDKVKMDTSPKVKLHFSYVQPETPSTGQPGETSPTPPAGGGEGSTDEPVVPLQFDVRFLTVFESESENGVWAEQHITGEKTTSKLMVIAENSQKITETVSIGVIRSSLNELVEQMDFVDDESGRKGDALGLMRFSDAATLLTSVTREKQEALAALDALEVGTEQSLLWDSLALALDSTPDHGAVLLITTGVDTGSLLDLAQVSAMAQTKGIPIYTVLVKTEESESLGVDEEHFRQFSENTGGCCYVIDSTDPNTDVNAGLSTALVAAYGGDRQNQFILYESTTNADITTRFVKIVYAPEGQEAVEAEVVSYTIP
ncbi:MAG TPA: hypothetical protein GX734_02650 [Clostridiaceae bacterium]|nr:hypothetical protein [Clostridiaceae bacterium]